MTGRLGPAVLALLILASAVFPAYAEKPRSGAILPGGNSKDPVNIDAAKLDYFDKEQKLVYTGNVVATQGESKLQTGTLVVFLTPKDALAPAGAPSSSSADLPHGSGGASDHRFQGPNRDRRQRRL